MTDEDRWDAVEDATELLHEQAYEEAQQSLNAVLERDPHNHYAEYFLGALHFEQNRFEAALAHFHRALELAPNYLGARVGLGHTLRNLGALDEALAVALQALAQNEKDGDTHFLLGLIYADQRATAKAIEHVEKFIASNPEVEARYDAEALLQTLKGQAKPLADVPS